MATAIEYGLIAAGVSIGLATVIQITSSEDPSRKPYDNILYAENVTLQNELSSGGTLQDKSSLAYVMKDCGQGPLLVNDDDFKNADLQDDGIWKASIPMTREGCGEKHVLNVEAPWIQTNKNNGHPGKILSKKID